MKFGQVIEYNSRNMFLHLWFRKWGSETSSRPFFVLKLFIWGKSKWSAANFQSLSIFLNLANHKNKICKTLENWSRNMLNFSVVENGLGIVSLPHFVYDFLRNVFLMLCSINWQNFIAWLPLLLEILVLQLFVNQVVTS